MRILIVLNFHSKTASKSLWARVKPPDSCCAWEKHFPWCARTQLRFSSSRVCFVVLMSSKKVENDFVFINFRLPMSDRGSCWCLRLFDVETDQISFIVIFYRTHHYHQRSPSSTSKLMSIKATNWKIRSAVRTNHAQEVQSNSWNRKSMESKSMSFTFILDRAFKKVFLFFQT